VDKQISRPAAHAGGLLRTKAIVVKAALWLCAENNREKGMSTQLQQQHQGWAGHSD